MYQDKKCSKSQVPDKSSSCPKTEDSQTAGENGPVMADDVILHETLETFVNEKTIERAVHTKGYGAFGHFTTLQSMKAYTTACFLQNPGRRTRTFTRFSLAVSTKGTPDTSRNVRGFSTKFYTEEGIFDLLCNHIPVFLVGDAMQFPVAIKSLSPSPKNNLTSPLSFWKFFSEHPEATNFVTYLYSDLGTLDNLRCMRTYGVNTYIWKNAKGIRHYVKYHWIPISGQKTIDRKKAVQLAGENPDIAGKDLYDTLAKGKTVSYDLYVQLMNPKDACTLSYNPLDDTKIWDECAYPLIPVGRLTLEKNVEQYQAQVEKSAFSPANLLEGIELSNDKMLQGRSFVYWDAQRRRIGPDFRSVPINHEHNWSPAKSLVTNQEGVCVSGPRQRSRISPADNFSQAGELYQTLSPEQKEHLADNIASELYAVPSSIQKCVLNYFCQSDAGYRSKVQRQIDLYQSSC